MLAISIVFYSYSTMAYYKPTFFFWATTTEDAMPAMPRRGGRRELCHVCEIFARQQAWRSSEPIGSD